MSKTFVLFGKTGAGKSYIASAISTELGMRRIKNTTTRPQRGVDDNEYNFVKEEDFLKDGDSRYVAVRGYNTLIEDTPKTHYYGVDKLELEKGGLLITDFEGFKELLERDNELVGIYIYSNKTTRQARARLREGYKPEEFERRNADDSDKFKIEEIVEVGKNYHVYIVENNLDTRLDALCDKISMIIKNHL